MSNYKDLDKRRETQRKYREKNREKINAYHRENYGAKYMRNWRKENPDKSGEIDKRSRENARESRLEYAREYYARNKEKLLADSKRKYQATRNVKIDQAKRWKAANPEKVKASCDKRKKKLFDWWYHEVLPSKKCTHCGNDDSECLDFHHFEKRKPGEKKKNPITMVYGLCARKSIEKEMEKCIVLCANCHRKEHARLKREDRGSSNA